MTRPIGGVTDQLEEPAMRAAGFTDHREGFWYYCQRVNRGITFNLTIEKSTGRWSEDVLDENFGQPYYYGRYAGFSFADDVRSRVDEQVASLNSLGFNVSVDHRQYGSD
jgi:hypothetical protein